MLLFNKFNINDNHVLIVTKVGTRTPLLTAHSLTCQDFQPQTDALNIDDMTVLWKVCTTPITTILLLLLLLYHLRR